MSRRLETHLGEYFVDHVVPMPGRPAEAVKSFVEEPVLIFVISWISNRWADDRALIRRKQSIAEGIFAVALEKNAFLTDSFGSEETQGGVFENRCIALCLGVVAVFKISEYDNAGFGAVGLAIFIDLDTDHAHGRESIRD